MEHKILQFARNLSQRKLAQWALAYLGAAWLVLQLTDVLAGQFNWPLVLQRSITVLMGIGFLAAVVFAWYHGEAGRQHVSSVELLMLGSLFILAGAAVTVVRRTTSPPAAPASAALSGPLAAPATERASIAMLPFTNISGDASLDYFGDGFTEELINRLANISGLRVASRSASFALRAARDPIREAGRGLSVQTVLEGSVRKSGARVRVTAQLINVADGFHLWSQTFDREIDVGGLLTLQDALAEEVSSALHVRLVPRPDTHVVIGPQAYDHYLRGLYFERSGSPAGVTRTEEQFADSAIKHYRMAINQQPDFALAHAALGRAYASRNFAVSRDSARFREAAFIEIEKALALDSTVADAYVARSSLSWTRDNGWPFAAAAQDLAHAVKLNSNSPQAHEALGSLYAHVGLFDRALAEFRAAQRIDPLSTFSAYRVPRVLIYLGKYDEALREIDKWPDAERNWHKPLVLWYLGRTAEARQLVEQQLKTTEAYPYDQASVYAMILASQHDATGAQRQIDAAIRLGSDTNHFHHAAYNVACAYALLGRKADAVRWLRRVARDGLPIYPVFATDPALRNLRGDRDFDGFLREQKQQFEYFARTL